MNPLEFRKLILVGLAWATPALPPLIGPDGLPIVALPGRVVVRAVFWIPQRKPYQRRGVVALMDPRARRIDKLQNPLEGQTLVHDAKPFELQALRDGVLLEEVYDFQYEAQPTVDQLRRNLMPVWERRVVETIGFLPNAAPEDHEPKLGVLFDGTAAKAVAG